MTRFNFIAILVLGLALSLGIRWVRFVMDDRDKYLARAEAAEQKIEELAAANQTLEAANGACNLAAQAQSIISQAALARRETLDEIMSCPASPETVPAAAEPKGDPLNAAQNRKMVAYWNGLFSGLGLRNK